MTFATDFATDVNSCTENGPIVKAQYWFDMFSADSGLNFGSKPKYDFRPHSRWQPAGGLHPASAV